MLFILANHWCAYTCRVGAVMQSLEHKTGDRGILGSNPGRAASEFLTPLCQCSSPETLKAVDPIYIWCLCKEKLKIAHRW